MPIVKALMLSYNAKEQKQNGTQVGIRNITQNY